MKKLNKKGFTLIELLAVIIILGILMIIAIPSVTEYINNSRKSAYLDTASGYISAVRTKVNELKEFVFTDTTKAYYVPVSNDKAVSCVSLEKGGTSPFGNWTKAYVIVTFDGKGYTYYFAAKDSAGYGVKPTLESDFNKTPSPVEAGSAVAFPPTNNFALTATEAGGATALVGKTAVLIANPATPGAACVTP